MVNIKFVREYKLFPESSETWFDVLYAKSNRLCIYTGDDLPKTVQRWLKGKVGVRQHDRVFDRDEIIYKAETMYKVEYDFYAGDKDVHAYLDNNGKGFCEEDAVYIGKQLAAQGNRHISVIAI